MIRADELRSRMPAHPSVEPAESKQPLPKGSRLIGKMLPMAMRLWLKTQADHVEGLVLQLEGTDRQILSGYIPGVVVAAQQAIYQGIHLSQISLSADEVRINLGQVLRGQPLRLLRSFLLSGEVKLTEHDLNASLQSDLLSEGICLFWQALLEMPAVSQELRDCYGQSVQTIQLAEHSSAVRIDDRSLTLSLLDRRHSEPLLGRPYSQSIMLQAGISIESGRFLRLNQPQWLIQLDASNGYPSRALEGFQWDLGSETRLQNLAIETKLILCEGSIIVNP